MLLIDCDLFHLLILLAISLKQRFTNVLQNFAKVIKNICNSVLRRKRQAASYQERTSSKVLSCKIWEIFQNSFLLEQLLTNVFVSGVGLAQLYKSKKYLIWVIKQITPHTNIQSYFYKLAFPKIKNRNILQKFVIDGVPFYSSHRLSLLKQDSTFSLNIFDFVKAFIL